MTVINAVHKADYVLIGRLQACRKLASDKLYKMRLAGELEAADGYGLAFDLLLLTLARIRRKVSVVPAGSIPPIWRETFGSVI